MFSITANVTARYILWCAQEKGYSLTNWELMKLLYYAQGWHLALYEQPLFTQQIEAWRDGPAQPAVYGNYKHNGFLPITFQGEPPDLPERIKQHLDYVVEELGRLSGPLLVGATHMEDPWIDARSGVPDGVSSQNEITVENMKNFFGKILKGAPVHQKAEMPQKSLLKRAEQEDVRFNEALERINKDYGDALRRLAQ